MSDNMEKELIDLCLAQIEDKLSWGPNAEWSNYDFEKLSEEIQSKTQVVLSITTLKRIWGKVKYENAPSLTTLNTLARYNDYEDWRCFKFKVRKNPESTVSLPVPIFQNGAALANQTGISTIKRNKKFVPLYLSLGLVGMISLYALTSISFKKEKPLAPNPDLFSFEANKVLTRGLPNSVVFHYDASRALSDAVFISQTWDVRRKVRVDKSKTDHSAIYHYPGYFRAKLIIDSVIVKTHDIQIVTDGWLALVENGNNPVCFKKSDFERPDLVEIDEPTLAKYNLTLLPESPKIRFFNQADLGPLLNDNFIFETTLKNPHQTGDNVCQYVQVLIQCKDDIIIVPLSAPACIGDLRLSFAGAQIQSKEADLSGFGCDLSQWTHLKIVTQDRFVQFFVNGKKAYELTFPHDPTDIVGVQFRFNGVGSIKETFFTRGERKIEL
ncbi:MAG: hypothetical protein SH818_15755 [Saprospiraceae bacterium]|nr:hypothetical protein [Saprospiraceae bacterium]